MQQKKLKYATERFILGDDKAVAALIKQLNQEMIVVDRPINVFELTIPKGYNDTIHLMTTLNHYDGWYRVFEKSSKKRNLKL